MPEILHVYLFLQAVKVSEWSFWTLSVRYIGDWTTVSKYSLLQYLASIFIFFHSGYFFLLQLWNLTHTEAPMCNKTQSRETTVLCSDSENPERHPNWSFKGGFNYTGTSSRLYIPLQSSALSWKRQNVDSIRKNKEYSETRDI